MRARPGQCIGIILTVWALALTAPLRVAAAPYAALVMDARDGKIIYQDNANTRLHPASLTKMLTLYITFDAIRRGEITLDTKVTVTRHAARQPPSRLGLRPGEKITLRYLIRAAAVKSANDAAAEIGDALSGNEAAFAARMNATAKALGLQHSTFKNANGLTRRGHLSTAHDMAILARHLIYDFPQYYNIFSRRKTYAGIAEVYSTNRKFLRAYRGADGIKTGYTYASGFNLVASAVRGHKRLIGVIFGEPSTAARNRKMAKLLDMGFKRVPERVALRRPVKPDLSHIPHGWPGPSADLVAQNNGGNTIRLHTAVASSARPEPRPDLASPSAVAVAAAAATAATANAPAPAAGTTTATVTTSATVTASATQAPALSPLVPEPRPEIPSQPTTAADPTQVAAADPETPQAALGPRPHYATTAEAVADNDGEAIDPGEVSVDDAGAGAATGTEASVQSVEPTSAAARPAAVPPKPRPEIVFASVAPAPKTADPAPAPEVISRLSTSGGHDWAITLGHFGSRAAAERVLLRTALAEPVVLDQALRKVVDRSSGYEANFVGLTHRQADLACARLQARAIQCFSLSP